ncbi:mitogen-activated protein kinase kinase kinase kinase 3-like [Varroa jacobsoni]|uniref:Mitogen-activated protein kinase kinase kinase kinase n=1 Tax=Varroa destructor TaxID=109461 RepID=A0A7M7J9F5_VARDE|nr:mitogen-activated protein kinase kinase kinase kinase 3-like [Varroa destructor]XP_022648207.1 mitogen-activated protein kinase kinase kinase kinase 3-like [Varroa destructor]XP_022695848.1 mitogen-activated protein kinase kinase kinase kinase 3-like [Varroa jacobsoni]
MALPSGSSSHADISRRNPHDEYQLIQRVGSGTYGDVFKAKRLSTNEMAAIKVIKVEPGDDFAIIQQEIVMMQDCLHPNIVAYFGSYLRRDKLWICMEYCGGGSLQDIYHITGPLKENQIAYVCRETLRGLYYLHSLNMMHRDVKGANILLTEDGGVKLADFGVSAKITSTIAKRKSFIGTPYWMAPEVAAVERKGGYNQQCDIWAVGITAIELAELQPPMFDLHPMRALFLMSKSNFKPPTLKDKDHWSTDFHGFVKLALTKNPKKRPTADRMLLHPFLIGELSKEVIINLIERVRNPSATEYQHDEEEDEMVNNVPQKIVSSRGREDQKMPVASPETPTSPEESFLIRDVEKSLLEVVEEELQQRATLPMGESLMGNPQWAQHKEAVPPVPTTSPPRSDDETHAESEGPEPPPRLRRKKTDAEKSSPQGGGANETVNRISTNGLPPTPKVHMGACLSKIFNECPLKVYSAASWIHPETRDQHIILGCEEGIYTLNLNELADACLDQIFNRRTIWLFVISDVLMSLSGKNTQLYRHDLIALHNRKSQTAFSLNRIPERFVPRRYTTSTKVQDTKGCIKCCVGRNPYNGFKYLCGVLQHGVFLMQWYNPLAKFMHVKQVDLALPHRIRFCEMIVSPDAEYPIICIGAHATSNPNQLKLEMIDLNLIDSIGGSPDDEDGDTMIPAKGNALNALQLQQDELLVCMEREVKIINLGGRVKLNQPMRPANFEFDFNLEQIVCLSDSVLAFHSHGMQGKSLLTGDVVQEIDDPTRIMRVLTADNSKYLGFTAADPGCEIGERVIVVESRAVEKPSGPSNLYILAGHESSY